MPYKRLSDLPDSVRNNLPEHAQKIYRAAFNSAWEQYNQPPVAYGRTGQQSAICNLQSAIAC